MPLEHFEVQFEAGQEHQVEKSDAPDHLHGAGPLDQPEPFLADQEAADHQADDTGEPHPFGSQRRQQDDDGENEEDAGR